MLQKALVLLLALAMICTLSTVYAEDSLQELKNLKIVNCCDDDSFFTDEHITRAEFSEMVSKMLSMVEGEIQISCEVFSDVPLSHWANEYITFCYINNLVNGIVKGDKVFFVTTKNGKNIAIDNLEMKMHSVTENVTESIFAPDEYITVRDAAKMIVIALGYEPFAELNGKYPGGYLHAAKQIGIIDNGMLGTELLTQDEAVEVIYKALHTPLLLTQKTETQIEYYVADGEKGNDYITLYTKFFAVKDGVNK